MGVFYNWYIPQIKDLLRKRGGGEDEGGERKWEGEGKKKREKRERERGNSFKIENIWLGGPVKFCKHGIFIVKGTHRH